MKAEDVRNEMLERDGKKMLKLALKEIRTASKKGYDRTNFLRCKSKMIAEYVGEELSKLGYNAQVAHDHRTKDRHTIKISWE